MSENMDESSGVPDEQFHPRVESFSDDGVGEGYDEPVKQIFGETSSKPVGWVSNDTKRAYARSGETIVLNPADAKKMRKQVDAIQAKKDSFGKKVWDKLPRKQ